MSNFHNDDPTICPNCGDSDTTWLHSNFDDYRHPEVVMGCNECEAQYVIGYEPYIEEVSPHA